MKLLLAEDEPAMSEAVTDILEYQMMETLMLNHGIYLSSEDLLEKVWGYDTDADVGAVWVYISYLRKRIASVGSGVKITAKRNIGYTLTF